jgi:hypothetical protein
MADIMGFSVPMSYAVYAQAGTPQGLPYKLQDKFLQLQSADEEDARRALRHCCMFGYLFVLDALLECGVDVCAKDEKQRTALFYVPPEAAWYKPVMRKLISLGASVSTPIDGCKSTLMHHYVVFDYETNRPRLSPRKDLVALRRGLEFARANGLSINAQDAKGRTALSMCLFSAEIKLLLSLGACIRTAFQSNYGCFMLMRHRDPAALAVLFHPTSPLREMTWDDKPLCHWILFTKSYEFATVGYKIDPEYFGNRLPASFWLARGC